MPAPIPLPQHLTPLDGPAAPLGRRLRIAVPSESLRPLGETVADLLARLHAAETTVTAGPDGPDGDLRLALGTPSGPAAIHPPQGTDPRTAAFHPPAADIPTTPTGPDAAAAPAAADLSGAAGSTAPSLAPADSTPAGGPTPFGGREGYELVVDGDGRATVTAGDAEGLFRGAVTFAQLLQVDADGFAVPRVRIADGPAYAWRGLSLDVVRRFFTVDQVKKVVDLLALYKFNVLHLHLSDSQAWRLEIGAWPRLTDPRTWPGRATNADDGVRPYYTADDYREIVAYAAARFLTVVPELDMPGHVLAAVRAYPELQGPDEPVHKLLAYLHPRGDATFGFVEDVLGAVAALTPGPFVHVGGDEAFGMPDELYREFVARALEIGRATGKRVVAWQEAARSGALTPADVVQEWVGAGDEFDADAARERIPAEYHALVDAMAAAFAESARDVPAAVAAGTPVLASASSVMYLDRRYAEDSRDAAQTARRTEVGHESYPPRTCRELFDWTPGTLTEIPDGADLAGVEAAIWCETVEGFDDLAFLLLPKLPGIAEKAWTPARTEWDGYRARLASHPAWWEALGWHDHYRSTAVFGG
ncbi:family 20 glycosylhydrolase [Actinomadura sp. WMMB 499]|uniref:family 20 glycosylhydrolase n=1 Tax=Actinomadura sp. WMMB 499 TaxID=1219491 RepID=UPI00159E4802|nr:family 20 glycosylhydrolase [Actinomadura sp. WMMB 499]